MSWICLIGCSLPAKLHGNINTIVYYDNGASMSIDLSDQDTLVKYVTELVQGSDDMLRLIVTKDAIDQAKQGECVEITFANELKINLNNLGKTISFSKILISLNNNSSIVFYCGKKKYFSPPYINSKGYPIAQKIKALCDVAARDS